VLETLAGTATNGSTIAAQPNEPGVENGVNRQTRGGSSGVADSFATPTAVQPPSAVRDGPSAPPIANRFPYLAPPEGPNEIGRLGTYRVVRLLGSGGMGAVFQAEDMALGRTVALKVMKPEIADLAEARDRFLREARAAAALEHENVITIYQVGEERGVPFLAMPWLKGMSLEDRLRKSGPLPPTVVARLGRQVANGLAAAHDRGLIHRDIKPANLWLEELAGQAPGAAPRYRIKVLDFGLARSVRDEAHLTQSGAILGTPAYMAPEQARGERVDHRCDLFSLGVVLYRMCTGRPPFDGPSTMAVLTSLAMDTPPQVRELNPAVPPSLADLITALLSKDPAQRPPSAREIANRLQAIERDMAAQKAGDPSNLGIASSTRSQSESLHAASTIGTSPIRLPAPARSSRRPLIAAAVALATLLPLGYFFGGQIIRVATDKGQIVIEVDDPKAEVTVKEGGAVIQDKTGQRTITLAAGPHKLEVTIKDSAGESRFFTKALTLSRGGKTVINVRQELAAVPAAKPVSAGDAAVRQAAEWALSLGGTVQLRLGDRLQGVNSVKDLPAGGLKVTAIDVSYRPNVTDAGLAHVANLPDLEALMLGGAGITDAGLSELQSLPRLRSLRLFGVKGVTEAGLDLVTAFTLLENLDLQGVPLTDTGLGRLASALPKLVSLDLSFTRVTEAGLEHLAPLSGLVQLSLYGQKDITDAGIDRLKRLPALRMLNLIGTQVTPTAVAKSLPNLTSLQMYGSGVTDAEVGRLATMRQLVQLELHAIPAGDLGLEQLKKLPQLNRLTYISPNLTEAGLATLTGFSKLEHLSVAHSQQLGDAAAARLGELKNLATLSLEDTSVTDAGLAQLRGLTKLQSLDLPQTKVTAAGVAEFRKALPKCAVIGDFPMPAAGG
jgi:serine/threonine protein kinase/Leucine-rich repeat (LRR) protein